MEHSSSWNDEDFVLEFSDDECSDGMNQTDNYGNVDGIQRDSKRCESSQLLLDYVQLEQENYYGLDDGEFNQIVKRNNDIFVDDESEQKFSSQYLTSTTVSPEKQQEISQNFEKDNISDEIVNFSKLVNQLLNAKVVIERLCVYSGTSKESTNKGISSHGSSVQHYCPVCLTVTVDSNRGKTVKKTCPKCKSKLKYLCSKCNSKHYDVYRCLSAHSKTCGLADSTLKELHPSNFLVKKTEIDFSKEIIRYCSRCNKVNRSCEKWAKILCQYCDLELLYQCNKCKVQYKAGSSLLYHMQSKCYPYQYGCYQCDFTCAVWETMRVHVISVHLRVDSNIEPPTQVLDAKASFRKLGKPLTENTVSETVGNHEDFNQLVGKGEINSNENVQLYCSTCKKTKFARIEDRMAKNCSDCETAMTFLCTNCNVKHYKRYPYLQFHLDRCAKNNDDMDTLDDDRARPNTKNKSMDATRFSLDKRPFIVKEFQYVNATEKWTRHCLKCGLVPASHKDRTCTCSENLLYVCKKCNVKCNNYKNMMYHSENECFPTYQYKCTQCNYSTTCWTKVQKHFKLNHTERPLFKCKLCSYETKYGQRWKSHTKNMHRKIDNKLYCGSCSYSTKYELNLRRHEKLEH